MKAVYGRWYSSFYNTSARRYESRSLLINPPTEPLKLTGVYTHPEGWTTNFSGQLGPSRSVSLNLTDGTISFVAPPSGGFTSSVAGLILAVRGGSADGQTLVFDRYSIAY